MASKAKMTAGAMSILFALALVLPANAAGVRNSSVLDHFADEDDLFYAIYEQVAGKTHGFNPDQELRIAEAVHQAALAEGIDPFLVLAVIHVESSFIRGQVSSADALGLMQVKPSTAEAFATSAGVRWRGPWTLFNVESNIRIGTRYLAFKLQRFDGDAVHALAAYCHGPTKIRRLLREDGSLDEEHRRYSERVLRMYRHYRGASGLPVA